MPTVKELIEHLQTHYAPDYHVAYVLYTPGDIQRRAIPRGMDRFFSFDDYSRIVEELQEEMDDGEPPAWDLIQHIIGKTYLAKRKEKRANEITATETDGGAGEVKGEG